MADRRAPGCVLARPRSAVRPGRDPRGPGRCRREQPLKRGARLREPRVEHRRLVCGEAQRGHRESTRTAHRGRNGISGPPRTRHCARWRWRRLRQGQRTPPTAQLNEELSQIRLHHQTRRQRLLQRGVVHDARARRLRARHLTQASAFARAHDERCMAISRASRKEEGRRTWPRRRSISSGLMAASRAGSDVGRFAPPAAAAADASGLAEAGGCVGEPASSCYPERRGPQERPCQRQQGVHAGLRAGCSGTDHIAGGEEPDRRAVQAPAPPILVRLLHDLHDVALAERQLPALGAGKVVQRLGTLDRSRRGSDRLGGRRGLDHAHAARRRLGGPRAHPPGMRDRRRAGPVHVGKE